MPSLIQYNLLDPKKRIGSVTVKNVQGRRRCQVIKCDIPDNVWQVVFGRSFSDAKAAIESR